MKRQSLEKHLMRLSLIGSLPSLVFLILIMALNNISIWPILIVSLFGVMLVGYVAYRIHQLAQFQFRSLSNLLEAMIQGDYSLRARSDSSHGALDELVSSINGLAERLSRQRTETEESQLLLKTVIDHIDVAIVALTEDNSIRFHNPAAEKLFRDDEANVEWIEQLEPILTLDSGHHQVLELTFGRRKGRFNIYVADFREHGFQRKLLFITDVKTLLRGEERNAWQRLVRVISHEINNSLTPIASISQTLKKQMTRKYGKDSDVIDVINGLTLISERAIGLSQFVESYKQIARLPEPKLKNTNIRILVEKVVALFNKGTNNIILNGESKICKVDPILLEQVLINLLKNAQEANAQSLNMSETHPKNIEVNWETQENTWKLSVKDQGNGISNMDNLFVPFYSTKTQGTGIGLVLCRQIIEAHGGEIHLANCDNSTGCKAVLELPLRPYKQKA